MWKRRCVVLALVILTICAGQVSAGRLFRLRTGNTLSENDVQLRANYVYSGYREMFINRYNLEVNYGISNGLDFTFGFPVYSLGGISDSLVIGDLLFDLLIGIKEWVHPTRPVLSSLFMYIGFQVGVGLSADEGLPNPDTGIKQTYYPFVNGLSQIYLGAGYSAPLGPLSLHLNLEWFNETRDDEGVADFELGNDHLTLRGGISWYAETTLHIFGGTLNLGFKPVYESNFRLAFSGKSSMPSRWDNIFGVWIRFGPIFRLYTAYSLPIALSGRKFMDREFFFSFAAVFR